MENPTSDASESGPNLTRSTFIVTKLSTGLPAAADPIYAQAISTNAVGLRAGEVSIPVPDGEMIAYQARPDTDSPCPVILVVQDIFGVNEHYQDVCRRLAKLGYWAIAPELFARQGNVSALTSVGEIMTQVVSQVADSQIMSDLDATLAWAERSSLASKSEQAVTGFCWGGRIAWLYCTHNPALKAGVAWYGRLEGATSDLQPRHPLDAAAQLRVPVLGLYGGADQLIPADSIERMRTALVATGNPSEIIIYPGAPHAFFADYRSSYRKEAAEDGWMRLQAWLGSHLTA